MESLLINFVNKTLDPATLYYFLHCYLDVLNSEFNIRENHKFCDFNFQLSKHLTRMVRALGHLQTVGLVDAFMDKFFLFLSNKLLPLLDHKLRPWDINAERGVHHTLHSRCYLQNQSCVLHLVLRDGHRIWEREGKKTDRRCLVSPQEISKR